MTIALLADGIHCGCKKIPVKSLDVTDPQTTALDGCARGNITSFPNRNGGEVRALTGKNAQDYSPDWTPDDGRIVFDFDRDIYVMDISIAEESRSIASAGGYFQGHYEGFGFAFHFWALTGNGDKAYIPSMIENSVYTIYE